MPNRPCCWGSPQWVVVFLSPCYNTYIICSYSVGRSATHRLLTTLAKVIHSLCRLRTRCFRPLRIQSYHGLFPLSRTLFLCPRLVVFYVYISLSYLYLFARKVTLSVRVGLGVWHKSYIVSDFSLQLYYKLLRKGTACLWRYGDKPVSASAYTKVLQPLLGMKDTFFSIHFYFYKHILFYIFASLHLYIYPFIHISIYPFLLLYI